MGHDRSKKIGGGNERTGGPRAPGKGTLIGEAQTGAPRVPGKRTLVGELQAKARPGAAVLGGTPESSGGSPLPAEVRAKMESAFSIDFSAVRVHEGSAAEAVGARAFTRGTRIHFAPGELAPGSTAGQELIGHELAHIVQQAEGRVSAPAQAKGSAIRADPALEAEADQQGERAARGERVRSEPVALDSAPGAIQAKTVTVLNFERLADQIHNAVDGLGTDEEAVYSALTALQHDAGNIAALEAAYKKYGNLREDLEGDFSGSELAYVLGLLTPAGTAASGAAAAGGGAPAAPEPDYAQLAKRIHDAVDGLGTDEEAVYTALSALDHDPAKIRKLEDAYKAAYKSTLREDLRDDFSGDELKHVLELLGDRSTSERVNVANDAEAQRAAEIIRQIYIQYGIDVNAQAGVDAIDCDYSSVPRAIRDKLRTKAWEFKELVALKAALDQFGPILGAARKDSTRSVDEQEIRTVSKVDQAIDEDTASGVLDTTTLGEYFEGSKNFSMFTAGTNSTTDFPDNAKQLEGTAIHEIAHGVMKYCLSDYVAAMPYWDSTYMASGKAGVEAPITDYGTTSASEDLSEAVMFYFVEPNTLKNGKPGVSKGSPGNPCPERYAFIDKAVKAWKKDKPAK